MLHRFSLIFPKSRQSYVFLVLLIFLGATGCGDENKPSGTSDPNEKKTKISSGPKTCASCHSYLLDRFHNFPCEDCHKGTSPAATKALAHSTLVRRPASPANMAKNCGRCHQEISAHVQESKHFTLGDEINMVRRAFGATKDLQGPEYIPQGDNPKDVLALADDLLRRRCLRCHPYSSGDQYSGVEHGQGCAACHLKFSKGSLTSHSFIKEPDDQICLSCHYGNFVGADYYGRFEHDFSWEYQTPFSAHGEKELPYGVNYHQLRPDIHKTAGLSCIDCHSGPELMATGTDKTSCLSCHQRQERETLQESLLQNISKTTENTFVLSTKKTKKDLAIPQMESKNHVDTEKLSCQVCHAQWSFSDYGTHLMRIDHDDYDPWVMLTQQGSSEAEQILDYNLFYDNEGTDPYMRDKFSGEAQAGLWLKGYGLRRWEDILTCYDQENILQVCRPILDIQLTYVDQNGEVIFDSVRSLPEFSGLQPYSPHTIGKAGNLKKYATPPAPTNLKP